MDTREIAVAYRLTHWAGILRERQTSGMSIRAYCKAEGICENVYYYWQRKLREAACEELLPAIDDNPEQSLVPKGWAAVSEQKTESGEIPAGAISIEIGKCRVLATVDSDPELLSKVCRMLASIC